MVAIPLAAGALSWAGVSLPPALGAVRMSASTVVVALNAQLLRRLDMRPRPVSSGERPARAEGARRSGRGLGVAGRLAAFGLGLALVSGAGRLVGAALGGDGRGSEGAGREDEGGVGGGPQ